MSTQKDDVYPDYYETLGLSRQCTPKAITTSYRKLAQLHHPDKNPQHTAAATAKFQKIQEAYESLSDPNKRQRYDSKSKSDPWAGTRSWGGHDASPSPSASPPDTGTKHTDGHTHTNTQSEKDDEPSGPEEIAHAFREELLRRMYKPHLWALLWKSTLGFMRVFLAYRMLLYTYYLISTLYHSLFKHVQYLVSGSPFTLTYRALLLCIFLCVFIRFWGSVVLLCYTAGAYYLFLAIREPFSEGLVRSVVQWTVGVFFAAVGAFLYACLNIGSGVMRFGNAVANGGRPRKGRKGSNKRKGRKGGKKR